MTTLMLRCYAFLARRPFVLVALLALAVVLASAGALRLRFAEDIFALLPADEPVVAETRLALDRFQGLERIVIALEHDDSGQLALAVDEAETRLRAIQGLESVTARLDPAVQDDIAALYLGRAPLLYDDALQSELAARLNTPEFARRLQHYLDRQAGSEGISAADTFRDDPFGFNELVLRRFERLNSGFDGALVGGRLFSRDRRMAVIIAEASFHANDTGRGRELMPRIDEALRDLPGGPRAHVIGAHRSSVDNAAVLRSDLNLTIATSAIAITLLFILALRALMPALMALLSGGFGFALALGVQGWAHGELSAITAGFAGVLMGISVDYAIHLSASFAGSEGDREQRARTALTHVATPALVAMLTTGMALMTLRFSSFDGLHQLSEMGMVGLAGALVFALTAGPQMLRRRGPLRPSPVGPLLAVLDHARRKARRPILALAVLITIGLGVCVPLVGFDGDVMNLDGKSSQTRESEAHVQATFGGETLRRTLVVSGGDDLQQALRANDLAARELRAMGARFESAAWVLPALATQRENIARWRATFNEGRIRDLKSAMAAAVATRPDTGAQVQFTDAALESRFARFFALLRLADDPPLLDADALRTRPAWALLANYISAGDRVYAACTARMDETALPELRARVPSALVVNKAAFAGRMVRFIRQDLLLMGGLSLLLVIVLLWFTFGRLRLMATALVPVAGSLVWTIGLMGLFGIPFNIINTLVAVFIAGLGIDYGIFFVQTWRHSASAQEAQARLRLAGSGVLVAALTTLLGFGTLALAQHPALFSVGITTALGIFSSLVLTLFVVPSMLERREAGP